MTGRRHNLQQEPQGKQQVISRRGLLTLPIALTGPIALAASRPNFLFVLVDDLRWDELGCTGHPFAHTPNSDRLAKEGSNFANAFLTTPLCSPSRASILTGQYAHTHRIIDNTDHSARSHQLATWPRLLHDAGYATAFLGKWHMGNDASPRPGFDYWFALPGQGETINPAVNINGKASRESGYITDILTDRAVEFIDRRRDAPFCVYFSHKAIHPNVTQHDDGSVSKFSTAEDFIPAPQYRHTYAENALPRRENYGVSPSDKPALSRPINGLPPLGRGTVPTDEQIRNRMRMMLSVDDSLGRMFGVLERTGQLNHTVIVLMSDNGYFYGEHGLSNERRLAFEESIRTPLLIRYPATFRPGSRPGQMALAIDIAPTMLELAGLRPPASMQGRSLLSGAPRDAILIEYFSEAVFPRIRNMGYRCVRTPEWKYVQYTELRDSDELYDLRRDPYELHNLIAVKSAEPVRGLLQNRLRELLAETRGLSGA